MMELVIGPGGKARCVYGEEINLASLGTVAVRRASVVEPDELGRWWADLSPIGGPVLGPYPQRSQALEAETQWLRAHWLVKLLPEHA